MAKDYKIFISHSWAHSDDLEALQNLLNSRGYFNVEFTEASKDVPINSENATYIKSRLKSKIINSDVVLALAGILLRIVLTSDCPFRMSGASRGSCQQLCQDGAKHDQSYQGV